MKNTKNIKEPTLAEQAAINNAIKDEETSKLMTGTIAGEIWAEIKDKNIEMFALPNQKVQMYVRPINIEPTKLYLILSSSAVLPSLESAIGNKFNVELADKYVIVTRAPISPKVKF